MVTYQYCIAPTIVECDRLTGFTRGRYGIDEVYAIDRQRVRVGQSLVRCHVPVSRLDTALQTLSLSFPTAKDSSKDACKYHVTECSKCYQRNICSVIVCVLQPKLRQVHLHILSVSLNVKKQAPCRQSERVATNESSKFYWREWYRYT
jgi:hypothetical protein